MPKYFAVSFISEGRFWKAGDPIPDESIKPFMLRYPLKHRELETTAPEYQITDTSVPLARHQRLRTAPREMAEMAPAVHHQDQLDQEIDQERQREDQRLKESLQDAQERHQAETERRKKELGVNAQRGDELHQDIVREKEKRLTEEGFYNVASTGDENGDSDSASEPEGARASVSPKPKAKAKPSKLYARRDGKFVLASTVNLIDGEALYRLRPRTFGKAQRYILHTTVNMKGK